MNDYPRRKLKELIAEYGSSLADDPVKCKGFLLDYCGKWPKEINVLHMALTAGIVQKLIEPHSQVPIKVLIARHTNTLISQHGLSEEVARWAVESWLLALGIASEKDFSDERETSPRPQHNPKPIVNTPSPVNSGESRGEEMRITSREPKQNVRKRPTPTVTEELTVENTHEEDVAKKRRKKKVGWAATSVILLACVLGVGKWYSIDQSSYLNDSKAEGERIVSAYNDIQSLISSNDFDKAFDRTRSELVWTKHEKAFSEKDELRANEIQVGVYRDILEGMKGELKWRNEATMDERNYKYVKQELLPIYYTIIKLWEEKGDERDKTEFVEKFRPLIVESEEKRKSYLKQ